MTYFVVDFLEARVGADVGDPPLLSNDLGKALVPKEPRQVPSPVPAIPTIYIPGVDRARTALLLLTVLLMLFQLAL